MTDSTSTNGRFAYEGLQRIFHEKARLGILTSLASHVDGVLFTDLKELCRLTDGLTGCRTSRQAIEIRSLGIEQAG